MSKCALTGSFDPITRGHLDIIKRASALFDEIIIVVLINAEKTPSLSIEDRVHLIKVATRDMNNITVDHYNGATTDYCKNNAVDCIVRGIRGKEDIDYEMEMANYNREHGSIETLFLTADNNFTTVSSSRVRSGENLEEVLTEAVLIEYNKLKVTL